MLKRLQQAYKRDRLGVLGVGSAVGAFVLWAFPAFYAQNFGCGYGGSALIQVNLGQCGINFVMFSDARLPLIPGFFGAAIILLLLRRR